MKLNKYRLKAAHPQYKPNAEIIVSQVSETKAVEFAEDIVDAALSIVEFIGLIDDDYPKVFLNSF